MGLKVYPAVIFLLLIAVVVADNCDFARKYSLVDLSSNSGQQKEFLTTFARKEGRFLKDGVGIHYKTGLTYESATINHTSGLPIKNSGYSTAANEALHLGLLTLAITNNEYARALFEISADEVWVGPVYNFVLDQLTKKISSYERFNQSYPGFGGFIPKFNIIDDMLVTPSISAGAVENGQLVWALSAAYQALHNAGWTALANRYFNYVGYMGSNIMRIYLENSTTSIMCNPGVSNVYLPPSRVTYFRTDSCNVCDSFESELFQVFMDLYGDFTSYGGSKAREKPWECKKSTMQLTEYNSQDGVIQLEKGNHFGAQEKIKYLYLPYFDIPEVESLYLNGEKARTYFSYDNMYTGLFGSCYTVTQAGGPEPTWVANYGIKSLSIADDGAENDVVTPAGAFPLLLHSKTQSTGIVWLANMLQGSKMQGPQGIHDSINQAGTMISPKLSWNVKAPIVIAFSGTLSSLNKAYLKGTGKYYRFITRTTQQFVDQFGNVTFPGSTLGYKLPIKGYTEDSSKFTGCSGPVRNRCAFAHDYTLDELFSDPEKQDSFIRKLAFAEGKYYTSSGGINHDLSITYDGCGLDYYNGYSRGPRTWSAASKESLHVGMLALAANGHPYAQLAFESAMEGHWNDTVDSYVFDQLRRKMDTYEKFNASWPGYSGYIPWMDVHQDRIKPSSGWVNSTPSLDNGENVWSLVAAYQALKNRGQTDLANRYKNWIDMMARNVLLMFLDKTDNNILCAPGIYNNTAPPAPGGYYRKSSCNQYGSSEAELFTFWVDLHGDWENYGGDAAREDQWVKKKKSYHKDTLNTADGPIYVMQGWWYGSYEMWKVLELPYMDSPIFSRLFLNGEKARSYYSAERGYPGMFSACNNVTEFNSSNQYSTNYISSMGIAEIAKGTPAPPDIITPYGAFPLLLHPESRPYGIVWLANTIRGNKMQGPLGIGESIHRNGDKISPNLLWDNKGNTLVALCGGLHDLIRQYLKETGKYERFVKLVTDAYTDAYGPPPYPGEELSMKLPTASVPEFGYAFNSCVD